MKNMNIKWFSTGMLSILLVFGLFITQCDNSTSPGGNGGGNEILELVYIGVVAFNAGITSFPLSNNLGEAKSS